jgi:hypothetical protein
MDDDANIKRPDPITIHVPLRRQDLLLIADRLPFFADGFAGPLAEWRAELFMTLHRAIMEALEKNKARYDCDYDQIEALNNDIRNGRDPELELPD